MIEIIAVAVISVLAFLAGWRAREQTAIRHMDEMLKNTNEKIKDHIRENVVRIKIEQNQGCYYAFNLDTDAFMAQGTTRQELEDVLVDKFPGKSFAAEESNLREMGFANVDAK